MNVKLFYLLLLLCLSGCDFGFVSTEKKESGISVSSDRKPLAADMIASKIVVSGQESVSLKHCSGAIIFTTKSSRNIASGVVVSTDFELRSDKAGTFFQDADCKIAVTKITLPPKSNTGTFFYKPGAVDTHKISVSSKGLATGTLSFLVDRSAYGLAISGNSTIIKGNCSSAYTVELQDIEGNNFITEEQLIITVSGVGSTVYADPACKFPLDPANNRTLNPGMSFVEFYAKADSGNPISLKASHPKLVTGSLANIPVINVGFQITKPSSVVHGLCSPAFNLAAFGPNGPLSLSSPQPVPLVSSTVSFYKGPNCTSLISAGNPLVLDTQTGLATFYVLATANDGSGSVTLGTGSSELAPSTSVNVPLINKLEVTRTGNQTATAGVCAPFSFKIQAKSGNSLLAPSQPLDVDLTATGNGGTFYLDSNCSGAAINSILLANGSSSMDNIFFKPSLVASTELSSRLSGNNHFSVYQGNLLTVVNQVAIDYEPSLSSLIAGECSPAPLKIKTQSGGVDAQLSRSIDLALIPTAGNITFHSSPNCTDAPPTQIVPGAAAPSVASVYVKAGSQNSTGFSVNFKDTLLPSAVLTSKPLVTRLEILDLQSVLTLGSCHSFRVGSFGASSPVPVNRSTALSVSATVGALYSNSSCTVLLANPSIASGSSASGIYYFKTTNSANSSVTIDAGILGNPAVTKASTSPKIINSLEISASSSVSLGQCSIVRLRARSNGVDTLLPQSLTVNVGASALPYLYSNSGCETPLSSPLVFSHGTSVLTLFLKVGPANPGSVTLTFTATPLSATRTISVDRSLAMEEDFSFNSGGSRFVHGLEGRGVVEANGAYIMLGVAPNGGPENIFLSRVLVSGLLDGFFPSNTGVSGVGAGMIRVGNSLYVAATVRTNPPTGPSHKDLVIRKFGLNGSFEGSSVVFNSDPSGADDDEAAGLVAFGNRIYIVGNRRLASGTQLIFASTDLNLSNASAVRTQGSEVGGDLEVSAISTSASSIVIAGKQSGPDGHDMIFGRLDGPDQDFQIKAIDFNNSSDSARALTVVGDQVFLAGVSEARVALAKASLVDGLLDPNFGSSGKHIISGLAGEAIGVSLDKNARLLVTGRSGSSVFVARLLQGSGAFDTVAKSAATFSFVPPSEGRIVLSQSDGNTIVVGTQAYGSGSPSMFIMRLLQ
jgi:hypothetical protein